MKLPIIFLMFFYIGMMLAGCASTPVVIGHCELPATLAKKSEPMSKVLPGLTPKQQHEQWAADRGYGSKQAKRADDLVDYVQGACQ